MDIKVKKKNYDGIVRLESSGEVKEVLMKEDFMKPKETSVAVCFRGKNSSGIIEFSKREIENLIKNIGKKMTILNDAKVMKFGK